MLLFKFKSYKNCFDSKNAEIFFIYEDKNYVIDLIFNKKSLYNLFYTLFKKLQVLRNYLLKNLILKFIRKFFNFTKTLILFIFKKIMICNCM